MWQCSFEAKLQFWDRTVVYWEALSSSVVEVELCSDAVLKWKCSFKEEVQFCCESAVVLWKYSSSPSVMLSLSMLKLIQKYAKAEKDINWSDLYLDVFIWKQFGQNIHSSHDFSRPGRQITNSLTFHDLQGLHMKFFSMASFFWVKKRKWLEKCINLN